MDSRKKRLKETDAEMKEKLLELKGMMKHSGLSESMELVDEFLGQGVTKRKSGKAEVKSKRGEARTGKNLSPRYYAITPAVK